MRAFPRTSYFTSIFQWYAMSSNMQSLFGTISLPRLRLTTLKLFKTCYTYHMLFHK